MNQKALDRALQGRRNKAPVRHNARQHALPVVDPHPRSCEVSRQHFPNGQPCFIEMTMGFGCVVLIKRIIKDNLGLTQISFERSDF
jgi:hypothetical protein